MTNSYYVRSGVPSARASLDSAAIRAEFAAIEAAFNLLPELSGNGNEVIVINSAGTGLVSVPVTGSIADTGSAQTFSNKVLASSCTFPTLNQNTTGTAGGLSATLSVAGGGTGRTTGTTAYGLIAAGTTAAGVQQTLPAGATTEILVGGGASALPSWTIATGSGAPVRATSPTLESPTINSASMNAPTLTNHKEAYYAPSAGSSFTVDLANGTLQKFTTNGFCTINLPASVAGKTYRILVSYGGTHGLVLTGGTNIKYQGGSAPAASSLAGLTDMYICTCDGTNTYISDGGRGFI